METPKRVQVLSVIAAVLFVTLAMAVGYRRIGLPPVVIVGGSSLVALVLWIKTYLRRPLDPEIIIPGFLLTVAALEVHMIEEYLTGFGPAMSRLFDISWTERSFLMVFAFVGPTLYALTALGLYYRVPLAGFLAWFIFIGPGVAEFTHFIFPILKPAIEPELAGSISQAVSNGRFVADMHNYWVKTTGVYYFPGMYTEILGAAGLVLPMATGVLPWLTPLAAIGLAIIVLMATGFHLRADERINALETGLWASIAAVIAIGRWDLVGATHAGAPPWVVVAALGLLVPAVIINLVVLFSRPVDSGTGRLAEGVYTSEGLLPKVR